MRVKDITEIIEWEIPLDKALEWTIRDFSWEMRTRR